MTYPLPILETPGNLEGYPQLRAFVIETAEQEVEVEKLVALGTELVAEVDKQVVVVGLVQVLVDKRDGVVGQVQVLVDKQAVVVALAQGSLQVAGLRREVMVGKQVVAVVVEADTVVEVDTVGYTEGIAEVGMVVVDRVAVVDIAVDTGGQEQGYI